MVMGSSILVTTLILVFIYNITLEEEFKMEKGLLKSFEVGFLLLLDMRPPSWFCSRIPSLLVNCFSLQPYFVTIPISNTGVTNLLSSFFQAQLRIFLFTFFCFFTSMFCLTLLISQGLRGDHWVLYNFIKARKQFQVFSTSIFVHAFCDYSVYFFSIWCHFPLLISTTTIQMVQ